MIEGAPSPRTGVALLAGAGACWAAIELVGQHLPPGYSPQQLVWSRYAAHLLFLLLMPGRRHAVWRTRHLGLQLLCSSCMLVMPICFVAGARVLSIQNVWAIFWVAPLLALVLGVLWTGEKPMARTWAVSGLAFAGAVLALAERPLRARPALLWPVGMALSFALYLVLIRKLRHESTESKLFYAALGVFLALTPFMPGLFVAPDLWTAVGMGAIGFLGLGCLFLIDRALEGGPIPFVAPLTFAVIPWVVGLDAVLGGGLGRRALLGAALVGFALVAHVREPDPVST